MDRRFPRSRYQRELAAMRNTFTSWRNSYLDAARLHPDDWQGANYMERADLLEDMAEKVEYVEVQLAQFPRLS